jgi:hypothetical protein
MSKEKQMIEEMAKDLGECHTIDEWAAREYGEAYTDFHATAEKMLDRGWSKQSEVVRCKDCKHFYQDGNVKVCRHWNCHSTEDDAYCSYAKMKGGAE